MKHTIKLEGNKAIVIEPNANGEGAKFTLTFGGFPMGTANLTPDQCGVLIFAIENAQPSALETIDFSQGVTCHGDMCAAGQLQCPTPQACGCKA